MSLQFLDASGLNPLPPGVNVTLTSLAGAFIASGVIQAGGFCSSGVSAGPMVASFTGNEAPTMPVAFTSLGASATVNVPSYQSPTYSTLGYAAEAAQDITRGWYVDPTQSGLYPNNIGKNLYGLLAGLSAPIGYQDADMQAVLASMRLPSSQGSAIDSFAYDFFQGTFYRFYQYGETDPQWISRIEAIFATQKATVPGLQAILNVFWPWILLQMGGFNQNFGEDTTFGGEDTSGGEDFATNALTGGYTAGQAMGDDTFGGEDTGTTFEDAPGPTLLPPVPVVFDSTTNPTLSALITPNIVPPEFCVYLRYQPNSDTLIQPILSPSAILTALVNAWKPVGSTPVYANNL